VFVESQSPLFRFDEDEMDCEIGGRVRGGQEMMKMRRQSFEKGIAELLMKKYKSRIQSCQSKMEPGKIVVGFCVAS
jgi:hypothetical protein